MLRFTWLPGLNRNSENRIGKTEMEPLTCFITTETIRGSKLLRYQLVVKALPIPKQKNLKDPLLRGCCFCSKTIY